MASTVRGPSPDDLLEDLTPAQIEAVTSGAAPLCVLASAGSGKTRVLTRRIAYRVMTGSAEPDHVLALTFTRKAATELQDRLRAVGLRNRVNAGTFHSVASSQLQRWWADRRQPRPVVLERKSRLLGPLVSQRPQLSGASLSDLAGEIEWAKARLVTPEAFRESAVEAGRSMPGGVEAHDVATLFARYEHEKTRRGLVDFDDLLSACAGAIDRDPAFAGAQRWRWRHVFVDEFQDVNPLQHRLLLAWLGASTDLCVVGDPNQAIYGWNGADPGLLASVGGSWPSTETVFLDDNHRCTPQIVQAASSVLGAGGARLRSALPDGPEPTIRSYPSELSEAAGVASALRRAAAQGIGWGSMAVLARTNAQLVALQEALTAAGVPVWAAPAPAGAAGEEPDTGGSGGAGGAGGAPGSAAGADAVDAVTLSTFHRAKGLEWDSVWVVGLEEGLVPIGYATTSGAGAEERRLLYVALTRAGRELHCSWARHRSFGGRPVPREPSRWLELISVNAVPGGDEPGKGPTEASEVLRWRRQLRSQRRDLAEGGAGGHRHPNRPGIATLPQPDPDVVTALRAWRAETARASGVPPYVVLHDITLTAVASIRPASLDELTGVPGLGPVKAGRFGPVLLSIVAERAESA